MEFEYKLKDNYFRYFIPDKPNIRECNLKITIYTRQDKPTSQQIYINNSYFIGMPTQTEYYNKKLIDLIQELYKQGYEINQIRKIIKDILIKSNNQLNKVYY